MNDFPKHTLKALARKGIRIVGLTTIPNMANVMPFATGERAYCVDDNGTGRVWSYEQVLGASA